MLGPPPLALGRDMREPAYPFGTLFAVQLGTSSEPGSLGLEFLAQ